LDIDGERANSWSDTLVWVQTFKHVIIEFSETSCAEDRIGNPPY